MSNLTRMNKILSTIVYFSQKFQFLMTVNGQVSRLGAEKWWKFTGFDVALFLPAAKIEHFKDISKKFQSLEIFPSFFG